MAPREEASTRRLRAKSSSGRKATAKQSGGKSKGKKCSLPYPEVYYGGCCFGAGFYIGAYQKMWDDYGPDMMDSGLEVSGDSAGAVVALAMALRMSPDALNDIYREVAEKCVATQPWYVWWSHTGSSVYMEEGLRQMLSDPLAYKKIEGVARFGTTEFFDQHRWHVSWDSNEDLINCIKGSYHIPFYCHPNRQIRNVNVVDGAYGFKGEDLQHGDKTLFIGIDAHADITRSFTNAQMFYPSVGKDYEDMWQSGYDAMEKWDGKFLKKVGQLCDDRPDSHFVSVRTETKLSREEEKKYSSMAKYFKPYRTPNWTALKVLWVLKICEAFNAVLFAVFVYYLLQYLP